MRACRPAGKDSEVLIAVVAEGGSKISPQLSQGHPLPALSCAARRGLSRIRAGSRPTVPFIADDIMETFDDFRAEEAFRLFADMAEVGQVIYLTHHQHLCEIVQRVCPGVRLHRLEDEVMKRECA